MKIICRKDAFTFPFARITGIRFRGYVSVPKVIGTPLKFYINKRKVKGMQGNPKSITGFIPKYYKVIEIRNLKVEKHSDI